VFIVVYDAPIGQHLSGSRFYRLKKFIVENDIERLQYSTFLCHDRDTAYELASTLESLIGEGIKISIFRVERVR